MKATVPNINNNEDVARTGTLHPNDNNNQFLRMIGNVADGIRQVATDLALRPYRVFLVTTASEGDEIGMGTYRIVSSKEILPTPLVMGISGISRKNEEAGILEDGEIVVNEISLNQNSEDDLLGRNPQSGTMPENTRLVYVVTEGAFTGIEDTTATASDVLDTDSDGEPTAALDLSNDDSRVPDNVNYNRLPKNRTFVPYGPPEIDQENACWKIKLIKIDPDVLRSGDVSMEGAT